MTQLGVGLALVTALCAGYGFGRRGGSASWQTRTSRTALGVVAANLVVLVIVRRLQRKLFAQRALPAALAIWGHRPTARPAARRGSRKRR